MKTKTYNISCMDLIRGTSCAIKIMLDCPLDFLDKETEQKVKDMLTEYCRSTMAKTVADHCVGEYQK